MDWEKIGYSDFSEDWRHRDRFQFAIPPIIITVTAVFIGVAFEYISNLWIRAIVLFISVMWTFSMLASLHKNILYKRGTEKLLYILENNNLRVEGICKRGRTFKLYTAKKERNWVEKLQAYKLILFSSWLCFVALLLLLIMTILQISFGWDIFSSYPQVS